MSIRRVPVDDFDALRHVLVDTETLLLDFDGPVCSVFANFPAPVVADHLREILAEGGYGSLSPETEKTDDPFEVFKYSAGLGKGEAKYVEAALRAYEVEAVATAAPTPWAHQVIERCAEAGRKVAIVSNNSSAAIESYFHQHGLIGAVTAIVGRTSSDPNLLKPNPHSLSTAMAQVATDPGLCAFVGDSESDVVAARAAGTWAIGYANKPGKVEGLTEQHPAVLITEMKLLMNAIISL